MNPRAEVKGFCPEQWLGYQKTQSPWSPQGSWWEAWEQGVAAQRVPEPPHSIHHMRTHTGRMNHCMDAHTRTHRHIYVCGPCCTAKPRVLSPAHPHKEAQHCSTWIFSGSYVVLHSLLEVKGKRNVGTAAKNSQLCPRWFICWWGVPISASI